MTEDRSPFRMEKCGDLTLLRRILTDRGYTQPVLDEWTGGGFLEGSINVRRLHQLTESENPFHTLIRLFLLAQPVESAKARAALTAEFEHLVSVGLLQEQGSQVRSRAMMVYVEDLLLASDFDAQFTGKPLDADHVMVCTGPSLFLDCLTIRKHAGLVLDLGTGSGIQAMWASRHADRVLATDTNPRALNLASFNARLNNISNIEFRQGSLYEPVQECRFDLIVANPPYVISPESKYVFRDGGMQGDSFAETVIRRTPGMLRENGYGVVLFNWCVREGEAWSSRPRQWVESTGCDAWVICLATQDPYSYASTMLKTTEWTSPERMDQILDQWLEYYRRMGITGISAGGLILRRRSASANWFRADEIPQFRRNGSCSEQVQDIFAAESLLAELADEKALLDHSFLLVPDHLLESELHAEGGVWRVNKARLKHTQGFECPTTVDQHVTQFILGFEARKTLREQVVALAAKVHRTEGEIAPQCVRIARDLMRWGFLRVEKGTPYTMSSSQTSRNQRGDSYAKEGLEI